MSMIITIDGPAASGKSTTARAVASHLGMAFLDTGALYRSITLAAMRAGIEPVEGPAMEELLSGLELSYEYVDGDARLLLAGVDISAEIRTSEVTALVSPYSALACVRREMVKLQRGFAEGRDLVAEGRDMGSVVFPDAPLKVFLKSDPEERARRRVRDFEGQGREVDLATVLAELRQRDEYDSGREHSPLITPADAVILDNSRLSIEEQVEAVVKLAVERRALLPGADEAVEVEETESAAAVNLSLADLLLPPEKLRGLPVPRMSPHYRAVWHILRGLFRLLYGIRFHNEEQSAVGGPLLVAANHIAAIDPPVSGTIMHRELTFVAKRELFIPVFGRLIAKFGAIPINRGKFDRVCMDLIHKRLASGGTVIIFPEGTRKPVGKLGRPKVGLGMIAAETGAPVLPLYIKGTTRLGRAFFRRSRIDVYLGRHLQIEPLVAAGLEGRDLYTAFGRIVMEEIARLQGEAGGAN
ncbi:MAG: (d)CMP kinase [bacterium]|nr:(d)CMP kinase [bacterium]